VVIDVGDDGGEAYKMKPFHSPQIFWFSIFRKQDWFKMVWFFCPPLLMG
jgi:hypothetical protein